MGRRPVVLVLDDDEGRRQRIRAIVRAADLDVQVFADMGTFSRNLSSDQPGCLVFSSHLDGTSAAELVRELGARNITMPMIALTDYADVNAAVGAMRAGAFDAVEKPDLSSRLLVSIRRAVAEDLERRARENLSDRVRRQYAELTCREREVLHWVVQGSKSSEIASRLGLQEKTVEVYRSRINHKMCTHNAAELVRKTHCIDV